ncbi:MAG: bifunctional folylpolyglutamate synthase/dihydrofolate synthase, partial [Acidimicrobiia bacterium]
MTPLERLFALEQFGIKLGLDNIRAILDALGHPERAYRSIHVAGTNGKGSVAAMVERGLRAAGLKTGRYTSPHLDRIEERVAIDGQPIDRPTFQAVTADALAAIDALVAAGTLSVTPTFFEVSTAIAFEIFKRQSVDVAVVEVGLGGRYDATNVLTPTISAITSIAFDHERHLGSTLAEIAFEKAGIAKRGVPLVIGRLPREAEARITKVAREVEAPLVDAHATTTDRKYPPLTLALPGRHQLENAAVAVAILER